MIPAAVLSDHALSTSFSLDPGTTHLALSIAIDWTQYSPVHTKHTHTRQPIVISCTPYHLPLLCIAIGRTSHKVSPGQFQSTFRAEAFPRNRQPVNERRSRLFFLSASKRRTCMFSVEMTDRHFVNYIPSGWHGRRGSRRVLRRSSTLAHSP